MTEILGIYAFLSGRLKSSPDLAQIISDRIFAGIVPAKSPITQKPPGYPLISFSVRSSRDITVVDGESAMVDCLIDVKLVHTGGWGAMQQADSLIFSLLHRTAAETINNIRVMGCYRTSHLLTDKVDGDIIYRYSIQTYRVRAYRLPAES